jgi:hypothetical protein
MPESNRRAQLRKPPRGDRGTDEWRPVTDCGGVFQDLYEVSDLGRVWGVPRERTPGGIMKQTLRGPYFGLNLSAGATKIYFRVHILVATAFLGECPPGQEVRHGPLGQQINWAVNLSYGTHADNMNDRLRDGTDSRGERCGSAILTREIVLKCRSRHNLGETQVALAQEFNVHIVTMNAAIRGISWSWL